MNELTINNTFEVEEVKSTFENANKALKLVDDIVLKNYLASLSELEIVPFDKMNNMNDIDDNLRIFKISKMVYEKNNNSVEKLSSVFNSISSMNCSVFIIMHGDGSKTTFYMGVKSNDLNRTTSSIVKTLNNALIAQFPGIQTSSLKNDEIKQLINQIDTNNVSSVSSVADDKSTNKDNNFVQGLDKLANALEGKKYTGLILATSTMLDEISQIRKGYENIYSQLYSACNMQVGYGINTNESIGKSFTKSINNSYTIGNTYSKSFGGSESVTYSTSKSNPTTKAKVGTVLGAGLAAVGSFINPGLGYALGQTSKLFDETESTSQSNSTTKSWQESNSQNESRSLSDGKSNTESYNSTKGLSQNVQMNYLNKSIQTILERIDNQLERLREFESLGMWENAAYFLSSDLETSEIAAATYKSLMRGENSGVEASAINSWSSIYNQDKTLAVSSYIKNFRHPLFYNSDFLGNNIIVNPCSYVSSKELALHMALPKKTINGLPVVEHAEFGKQVSTYEINDHTKKISLGKIYNMGTVFPKNDVRIDRESLSMHTFITGSTGSGKSNTIYEILQQLEMVGISFMVIEPAKGEYKNIFNSYYNVDIYGTNPKLFNLIRINPFSFSPSIHVLEHIDRLVEIFNVCWPMYAAMPAILKDAILNSYEKCGWDLEESYSTFESPIYPSFIDVKNEIIDIIKNSEYSAETKSDYIGSLVTRINSLTNGINGQIFCNDEITAEDLFNKNVIIDLSRVGSTETKSLIMGLLIIKLNEFRLDQSSEMNSSLKHVTVLEEAHNILKRTSFDQDSESANILGKSVEMITNSIAEMRTYGEGFIIADQSPSSVDRNAIKNTNTKIIMRLPDEEDRRSAGKSAALKDEQLDELSKLPKGVAAVFQNDWDEPVLCKINKCNIKESQYNYEKKENNAFSKKMIYTNLLKFLLSNRVELDEIINIEELIRKVPYMHISTKLKIILGNILQEFKETSKLDIWNENRFNRQAELISNLIIDDYYLLSIVNNSCNFTELNYSLSNLIKKANFIIDDDIYINEISHCLLKHFSSLTEEGLVIYANWKKEMEEKYK